MKVEVGDILVIFAIGAVVKVVSVHRRHSYRKLIVEDVASKAQYSLSGFAGENKFTLRHGYGASAQTVSVVQAGNVLSFIGLFAVLSLALYFFG